jgi:lipopolysaccharide export LptBFGC system permease protein LptF
MGPKGYYSILEISETASQEDIERAYRYLLKKNQSYNICDPTSKLVIYTRLKEIDKAYEILGNNIKRIDYDQSLVDVNSYHFQFDANSSDKIPDSKNNDIKKQSNWETVTEQLRNDAMLTTTWKFFLIVTWLFAMMLFPLFAIMIVRNNTWRIILFIFIIILDILIYWILIIWHPGLPKPPWPICLECKDAFSG